MTAAITWLGDASASPAPIQALGYIRVSTDEQAGSGAGLVVQRAAIVAECDRRAWQLAGIVEDAGYSAKDLRRPGIQAALEQLHVGSARVLVVAKLDRLSRSLLDFAALMERANRQGWGIVALDCPVDTTTPAGEAMAGVLAIFAQFERRLIGQRTREALAAKRANGVRLGRPRSLSRSVRERILAEYEAGSSLTTIAARLNAERIPTAQGGRQWWPSTIRAVLTTSTRP